MIRSKLLKRALSTALALSLVMAPAMGVNASTNNNKPSGGSGTSVTASEAVTIPETSTVKAGGKVLVTTVKGAYMSKTFAGTAVLTDKGTLAAGYGLEPGAIPYARVYDITEKNSPAAMESLKAAAGAVGGTIIGVTNMELGKMLGGKFSLLAQGGAPISVVFSVPQTAVKPGYAYAMICVRAGGAVEILPDLDNDPQTVTFNTTGGLGAYAMIMYPAA